MAATLIKRDFETSFCIFSVENEADLDTLPTNIKKGTVGELAYIVCCCGSKAVKNDDSTTYKLGSDGKWKKTTSSGGGGGGDIGGYEYVDKDDIDNLFPNETN